MQNQKILGGQPSIEHSVQTNTKFIGTKALKTNNQAKENKRPQDCFGEKFRLYPPLLALKDAATVTHAGPGPLLH